MRLALLLALLAGGCASEATAPGGPTFARDPRERIRKVTDGNDFKPPTDLAAWKRRVRYLREQQLVASGLWPLPERCPLNPVVTKTIDQGDYVVENLYFASLPGFYVTGSLFRPKGKGPYAGVLCTHGHDRKGRFQEGPEKTRDGKPNSDRYPYQARCITLARLGCVAFLYDMVGYADSKQIRHPTDAPKTRVAEGTDDLEGLECEQYLLSTMGLQTWNSIRAIDYLLSRPDVDPARIAVTGESGGATQTLMLMMTDDRLACSAPVCMVSTGFQGDCTCEQAALGKIGTDTVEFCAAFAPKPLIVVSATGDWTKELIEKGGPEIRATYELLGAGDRANIIRFEAPHNYNKTSREAVYNWFNRWLKLGHAEPIVEPVFDPIDPMELVVFDTAHPRPADALDAKGLKDFLINSARESAKLQSLTQRLTALQAMVATNLPDAADVHASVLRDTGSESLLEIARKNGSKVEAKLYRPGSPAGAGVVVVSGSRELVDLLLARGVTVLDVAFRPASTSPNSGFFACFNRTLFAERVHDILTATAFLKGRPDIRTVDLVGLDKAGPCCMIATLLGEYTFRRVFARSGRGFRSVKSVEDELYLPGALRYADIEGLARFDSPQMWIEPGPVEPAKLADWLTRP